MKNDINETGLCYDMKNKGPVRYLDKERPLVGRPF
jgi:hypothetical protein